MSAHLQDHWVLTLHWSLVCSRDVLILSRPIDKTYEGSTRGQQSANQIKICQQKG